MKKVLYVSNIEVPYRVKLFNELSKHFELTVLYERYNSDSRNDEWTKSEKSSFRKVYCEGFKIWNENSFSIKALAEIFRGYDRIIIGCYNSPVQMIMLLLLKILNKPYILNFDGEVFADGKGIKNRLKRFFIKGADKYLIAGKVSAQNLEKIVGKAEIIPYYFSSLTEKEIEVNAFKKSEREDFVLVVGQYLDVKGIDVALESAKMNENIRYKFIGMGSRTDLFIEKYCPQIPENVEFIPFLKKEDLEKEYRQCSVFVLPSRQECWGLVINEAASFGTPIVSTTGSGAAVEFLSDSYSEYLVPPDDSASLYNRIVDLLNSDNTQYSRYLLDKSRSYTIENGVSAHIKAIEI